MVTMGFPGGSDIKESACQCKICWFDPWEKGMATHFSILAQEIPWAEEPGRLQSMGLQKVRHDLATKPGRERQMGRERE